jgi:hypothetical protein
MSPPTVDLRETSSDNDVTIHAPVFRCMPLQKAYLLRITQLYIAGLGVQS